jgi:hypothetical protein
MRAGWRYGFHGVSDFEVPRREAFDAGIGQGPLETHRLDLE